jgi:hypothetical protein
MTICSFAVLAFATVSIASPTHAAAPSYQFVPGETLRYLIQRDPYFDDPKGAIETVSGEDYRPPVVERLTEKVLSVKRDGTATLKLTLAPEPGFEDEAHPQAAISRMVTVTASGRVVSVSRTALGNSPAERDLLRGIVSVPPILSMRKDGLAVETRRSRPVVTQSTSPDHDGTLLQTTSAAQSDHLVFDCRRGQLVREVCTETITLSLVMTGRGRRGSDDFGHVIPNSTVVQTLTVERQAD